MPQIKNERDYTHKAVVQTLEIISALLDTHGHISLENLGRRIGASKNKAFRVVSTLIECGVLDKNCSSKLCLGPEAVKMARRILAENSTINKMRPILAELAEVFNEAVYLGNYSAGELTLVDFVDCRQPIKAVSFVGKAIGLSSNNFRFEAEPIGSISGVTVGAGIPDSEITTIIANFTNEDGLTAGAVVVLAPTFRMPMDRVRNELTPILEEVMQRMVLRQEKVRTDMPMTYPVPTQAVYSVQQIANTQQ